MIKLPQNSTKLLNKLRRLSGLTWDHLADLFGISKQSLYLYASGKPMDKENEQRLLRLEAVITYIDKGSASQNRRSLLQETQDGSSPLKLLKEGEHERVKELLGKGKGRRSKTLAPLSKKESEARKPLPPDILVDALQDTVHQGVSSGRGAKK